MKKSVLFLAIMLLGITIASAQSANKPNDPAGKWKFEAPTAPEGYKSGTIEVAIADNNYSTSISFTGNDFKIPGEKIRIEKDSVSFIVYVEGNQVSISLKMEDAAKMSGKALYSDGEIPLTLTRDKSEK
jgi:hypothetical protein